MGCSGSINKDMEQHQQLFEEWARATGVVLDAQSKEYMSQHNVSGILQKLVKSLLKVRPEDPESYLIGHLGGLKRTPTNLFDKESDNQQMIRPSQSHDILPRLLVLTDVGEEVDDEAALWLLLKHIEASAKFEADVVFVTGEPMQRAMRWAGILNSYGHTDTADTHIRYFVGPGSDRHMRYELVITEDEIVMAGMGDLKESFFDGGEYDVVLQMSPVGGFSDQCFSTDVASREGALARIVPRAGCEFPMYIIIGTEGATNFPKDALHIGFKKHLKDNGFTDCHVEGKNYTTWKRDYFDTMPRKLVDLVLEDEWNKTVGRIQPAIATLFVRFRVNALVNYDSVARAFSAFEANYSTNAYYDETFSWYADNAAEIKKMVLEGYILKSREADDGKQEQALGNPEVCTIIKGMAMTWKSIMSTACKADIIAEPSSGIKTEAELDKMSVDDAMGWAVTLMTGRLLRIYAFSAYSAGAEPTEMQYKPYMVSSGGKKYLDFHTFPKLHGDLSVVKKEAVGSPMYDPSGMLIALLAMSADGEQMRKVTEKLNEPASVLETASRVAAMRAAYEGKGASDLMERFFPRASLSRILVFADGGEEADDEAALWILAKHMDVNPKIDADIVFVSGNPTHKAMRWASIIRSIRKDSRPTMTRMRYFSGPTSDRPMTYQIALDEHELVLAGLGELARSHFDGGAYDIVLQINVLDGFTADFSGALEGRQGALGRVTPRACSQHPLYIVVGIEGSDNFPDNELHVGFKNSMINKGFKAVHVERTNFVYWQPNHKAYFPHYLMDLVLEDEWNKTIRRIPPTSSTLFNRFRMNTLIKYEIVARGFAALNAAYGNTASFAKAQNWWEEVQQVVQKILKLSYVEKSRGSDHATGDREFGNPKIAQTVKGMGCSWQSVMSSHCCQDIVIENPGDNLDISTLTVDDVMGRAVTLMTGRLLLIYAVDAFLAGREPSWMQVELYLTGTKKIPPLDFRTFPRLLSDMDVVKKEVVGSKMADSTGMLFAILVMCCSPRQVSHIANALNAPAPLLDEEQRVAAMTAVCSGEGPVLLVERFFESEEAGGAPIMGANSQQTYFSKEPSTGSPELKKQDRDSFSFLRRSGKDTPQLVWL